MLSSSTPLISIDTGVFVEFIDTSSDFHGEATTILDNVASGKALGLITHPVFAELYYVAERVYESADPGEDEAGGGLGPEERSENLVKWLFRSPNVILHEGSLDLAIEAGRLKKKYAFSLPDCYVIAAARLKGCKAIFRAPEEEMSRGGKVDKLKNEDKVELVFLEEYS